MTPSEIEVRALERPADLAAVVRLYETVFRLGPEDGSLNPRLLVGVARNGGSVLGAFVEGELVGFTLSFLARDAEGDLYQYSQLATVAREVQGRGVGRALKFAQRGATLAMGLHEIRWAFDPFAIRNAHFNLDVLGAHAVGLVRDLYGSYGHGLDVATSTHRLTASWLLEVEPEATIRRAVGSATPLPEIESNVAVVEHHDGGIVTLSVPTSAHGTDEAAALSRETVVAAMEALFADGLVALSCSGDERLATYYFAPRSARGVRP